MLRLSHPPPSKLLALAKGVADGGVRSHAESCRPCTRRTARLGEVVRALREDRALDEAPPHQEPRPNERLRQLQRVGEEAMELSAAVLCARDPAKETRGLPSGPALGMTLLYIAQRGALLAVRDPRAALDLVHALEETAASRHLSRVSPDEVRAESALLASQVLLNLGQVSESLESSESARALFRATGGDAFSDAVCDYFSANALSYGPDHRKARRLLDRAVRTFAEYGQDAWVGRAELCIGTLLAQHGRNASALPYLDRAIALLDPELDANSRAVALLNHASTLSHLGRYDQARGEYAEALGLCRRFEFAVLTVAIRLGLAEIDFLLGRYEKALPIYELVERDARELSLGEQVLFAMLYRAECQARLGRDAALDATLRALREHARKSPFQAPALAELFDCVDSGDVEAGLIAHVREALADPGRAYRSYRLAG